MWGKTSMTALQVHNSWLVGHSKLSFQGHLTQEERMHAVRSTSPTGIKTTADEAMLYALWRSVNKANLLKHYKQARFRCVT